MIAAGAIVFLVLIPVAGWRLLRMTQAQLLDRVRELGMTGWFLRLTLAGVGWGVAGLAMSAGGVLAVTADATGNALAEISAVVLLVIWMIISLLAAITTLTGSPRLLRLPQVRGLEWQALVGRREVVPDHRRA